VERAHAARQLLRQTLDAVRIAAQARLEGNPSGDE
jgi:hypothetical protein